jgi:hypothetical protein
MKGPRCAPFSCGTRAYPRIRHQRSFGEVNNQASPSKKGDLMKSRGVQAISPPADLVVE